MLDIMLKFAGCCLNVGYTSVRIIGYAKFGVSKSFLCKCITQPAPFSSRSGSVMHEILFVV